MVSSRCSQTKTCAHGEHHQNGRQMVPADRGTKAGGWVAVQRGELPRAGRALLLVKNDSNLTVLGLIWDHKNRAREVRRKFPSPLREMFSECGPGSLVVPRLLSCRGNANAKPLLLA